MKLRNDAFHYISAKYKKIDSAGKYENNIDGPITFAQKEKKIDFL